MLTRVQIFLLVVAILFCAVNCQEKPDKRPALLSRYGRASLPRYGKRSAGGVMKDDSDDDYLCETVDGQVVCAPYNLYNYHNFFK